MSAIVTKLKTARKSLEAQLAEIQALAIDQPEGWEEKVAEKQASYADAEKAYNTLKSAAEMEIPEAPAPMKSLPKNAAEADEHPDEGEQTPKNKKYAPNVNKGAKDLTLWKFVTAVKAAGHVEMVPESVRKEIGMTQTPTGGWALPTHVSDRIIQRLENALVFDRLSVTTFPVTDGNLEIPKENGDIQAYWVKEHGEVTLSDFTGGSITLNMHHLAAAVAVSNQMMNSSAGAQMQDLIETRIVNRLRRKMEYSFLYGQGAVPAGANNSGTQPRGLKFLPNVTEYKVGASAEDPATTTKANGGLVQIVDYMNAVQLLDETDVPDNGTRAWLMNPRQLAILRKMADEVGRAYFLDNFVSAELRPMLLGYPVYTTNNIPKNLTVGSSADTSDIFFGEWENFVIGQGQDIQIGQSDQVKFLNRQTVFLGELGCDCNVMYDEAFVCMTGARTADVE